MKEVFSVSALFVCNHFPLLTSQNDRIWEELIICLSCEEEDVIDISINYFKSKECEYETIEGKALWEFYGIIDIYKVFDYDNTKTLITNNKKNIVEILFFTSRICSLSL